MSENLSQPQQTAYDARNHRELSSNYNSASEGVKSDHTEFESLKIHQSVYLVLSTIPSMVLSLFPFTLLADNPDPARVV